MDGLAAGVGSALLAAIRRAEFSVFLRYRKRPHRNWLVAGKLARLLLGCLRNIAVPDALHDRSRGRVDHGPPPDRRHRVHVRSASLGGDSIIEFVSCCNSALVVVGDLAA